MPDAAPVATARSQGQPARAGLGRVAVPDRRWLQAGLVLLLALETGWLAWVLLAPVPAAPVAGGTLPAHRPLDPQLAARAFAPGGGATAASVDGLVLVGLRRAATASASTAIIADGSGGAQRAYRVGDAVRPGLRLASVEADHVTLHGPAGDSRLALPADALATPATPVVAPVAPAPPADGATVDPRRFMAETGLRPRLRGGRLDGFTIIPRGDGRALRSAGLQSGDVLLAVNGEALTPERMAELGQLLQSGEAPGGATTLTVERDQKRHVISLHMESP